MYVCMYANLAVSTSDNTIPKQFFYGELKTRKCPKHERQKKFKDNLKHNLMDARHWEESTLNRLGWRHFIR